MHLKLKAGKLERGTAKSAGWDLFSHEPDRRIIQPGEVAAVRVGVVAEFPEGYAALIWDKSGYARKFGLVVLGGLIDGDYPDEWLALLLNTGKEPVIFDPGMKVTQVIFVKVEDLEEEVGPGARFDRKTGERTGGFGSTGNS